MKLLYLSCHSVLEYDELRMFLDLGIDVRSHGAYTGPAATDGTRPTLPGLADDPEWHELTRRYTKERMGDAVLDGFDAIVVMHMPAWLIGNEGLFTRYLARGGRIIWRSIGQTVPYQEATLAQWRARGVELVRYSPLEATITNYAGEDELIRFGKYPDDYEPWQGTPFGQVAEVVNFTKNMPGRARFCGLEIFKAVMAPPLHGHIYGPENEELGGLAGGARTPRGQRLLLQGAGAYFHMGTHPAAYTLSLTEAMLAGVPLVAVGPRIGNGPMFPGQFTYEGHHLAGLDWSADDPDRLRTLLGRLLTDLPTAQKRSEEVRARGIEFFSADTIKPQWAKLLGV